MRIQIHSSARFWVKKIKTRATTNVLRWIAKAGGFDRYILTTPPSKLNSDLAMSLRTRMTAKLVREGEPLPKPVRRVRKPPPSLAQAQMQDDRANITEQPQAH
eukprot:Opistho-2@10805